MQFETLGPYRIGKRIGHGGMGEVFAAVNDQTNELAAVKVLHPQLALAEGFRERFEAEIESLRMLRHPNIVRLLGYGEQDGYLFYSMEFVDGRSLEVEIASGRRFTWHETAQIGIQLAKALKHAHDVGVIHRDIKPANVVLSDHGEVKLLDFGIARLFGNSQMTSAGGMLGTADYMSPEQIDGRPLTDKCDQYSLGGVLYFISTGRPPFRASTLPELLQLQRFADPEPLRRYAGDYPEEMERIVRQLLEKDPENRFPHMQMVARRLEAMDRALSRPIDDGFELEAPSSPTSRMASVDPLGATREFDRSTAEPAGVGRETTLSPEESNVLPTATGIEAIRRNQRRFTTVEEEQRRERQRQRESWLHFSQQMAGVVGTLLLVAAAAWYLTRPPSADDLFTRIDGAADSDRLESLLDVQREIDQFLELYPDDPRAKIVMGYRADAQLAADDRRLQASAKKSASKQHNLAPIERMYVQAIRLASEHMPERALAELTALVDLFDDDLELTDVEKRCLTHAQRQIKRLEERVYRYADRDLEAVTARYERAVAVEKTDPAKAQKMWKAIVDLFSDKPWAQEVVAKSRAALKQGTHAEEKTAKTP